MLSDVEEAEETQILTEEDKQVLDEWIEIADLQITDLFEDGWSPRIKRKRNGAAYITIRHRMKDDEGKVRHQEKSIGPYNEKRWNLIMQLYSKGNFAPVKHSHRKGELSSKVMSSQMHKPTGIPPTIHIELETLQWFMWTKQTGYPGDLDQFVNAAVSSYFRQHHHLELAVVMNEKELTCPS